MGAPVLKKTFGAISASMPFAVIGGLLYAGIFIKPVAVGNSMPPPAISKRDAFYGLATPGEKILWAVGLNGKIVRSENDGATWIVQAVSTKANLQSIVAIDPMHAFVFGNEGSALVTDNGGVNWSTVQNIPKHRGQEKFIRSRQFADGRIFVVGEFGLITTTDDGGHNWTSLGRQEDVAWNDIAVSEGVAVVVGEFGNIRRSVDGGRHWRNISSPTRNSLSAVAFGVDGRVVATGLDGVILVSNDAGQNWQLMSSGTHEHLFDVARLNDGWIVVGDKGVLLRSDEPAQKWQAHRMSEQNYDWYTQIAANTGHIYIAGASITAIDENNRGRQLK